MLNRVLAKLQSNAAPRYDLSGDLRPFGWPHFPEEVSDHRIVLITGPSSEVPVIQGAMLVFVIIVAILYYFTHHIVGLIVIIVFLTAIIFPYGAAERIVFTTTGISLTRHVLLMKRIKTIPREKIHSVSVEHSMWGLMHVGLVSVTRTDSKAVKLFTIYRKSHDALVEDSRAVVQKISSLLDIPQCR